MSKRTFLFLSIAAGILINWPHLNFINTLSQGDHGRDLYTFEQVFKGKTVYKDIWWVYGPLMPYYYGLCDLIFGFKISSVLLGKFFLSIAGGIFFYLASEVVMPAIWAFFAACYFMQTQQEFFFTFNHLGAIVLSVAVFWLILRYLYEDKIRLGLWALGGCLLIGLIKINFGLSALVTTLVAITVINFTKSYNIKDLITKNTKLFYIAGITVVPVLWILVYAYLFGGLTINEIRQCMPYFGDDQPYHRTVFETIPYYLTQHWLTLYHHTLNLKQILIPIIQRPVELLNPMALLMVTLVTLNFLLHPIIHGSTLAGFFLTATEKFKDKRRFFWMTQMAIWTFFILNFHEFVVSGVWYRTYWSQPFLIFFGFFMIATSMFFSPQWLRYVIGTMISVFLILMTYIGIVSTNSACTPNKFLSTPRGQVYVGNEPEWVDTVNTVSDFLNKNLKNDELFFALPYDCIYYYMTGRPSPTRQLIFFDHIKIPAQQEMSIIQELEKNKTAYVVMSNRIASSEQGLGIFGKTYCPLISQYIAQNFTPVYRYGGNWQAEPGWGNNHGVIIFKRKQFNT